MKLKKYILLGASLSVLPSMGALSFTADFNGIADTSASQANGFRQGVLGFGESDNNTFNDFFASGNLIGSLSDAVGLGRTDGYFYAEIGTFGDTNGILNISADNIFRSRDPQQFSDILISFVAVNASSSFTFQESGNDVLDSGTLLNGSLTAIAPTTVAFRNTTGSIDLNGQGLQATDRLFVRITNAGTGTGYLDNLSITSVPEPSAAALLGLGGLSLLARRKRS